VGTRAAVFAVVALAVARWVLALPARPALSLCQAHAHTAARTHEQPTHSEEHAHPF
jgi:hypothetical protein